MIGAKKQRNATVGSKINTGLKKDLHEQRENFDSIKKIEQVKGNNEFVSTELQRFMDNHAEMAVGNAVHSPMHNRFDGVRDSDVYNSLGSSSGWKSML